jgi:hypothetical protein
MALALAWATGVGLVIFEVLHKDPRRLSENLVLHFTLWS